MKKTFIISAIIAILINSINADQTAMQKKCPNLEKDKTYHIYETKIKIRDKDSLESNTIATGLIGETVKIIEMTGNLQEIYGFSAYWYKVQYKNLTGYVWGGLLSFITHEEDFDNDGKKELLLCRIIGNIYDYMTFRYPEIRLCRNNTVIADNLKYVRDKIFDIGFYDIILHIDPGFNPKIILIEFASAFGDGPFGTGTHDFYILKNSNLVNIFSYSENTMLNDYEKVELLLPSKNSKHNKVILRHRIVKHKDNGESTEVLSDKTVEYGYIWDGNSFNQVK